MISANIHPVGEDSQIVIYQPDESIRLEVKLDEDTVWLTQAQMVELFGSSKTNISEHISNIYQQEELLQEANCSEFPNSSQGGQSHGDPQYKLSHSWHMCP